MVVDGQWVEVGRYKSIWVNISGKKRDLSCVLSFCVYVNIFFFEWEVGIVVLGV